MTGHTEGHVLIQTGLSPSNRIYKPRLLAFHKYIHCCHMHAVFAQAKWQGAAGEGGRGGGGGGGGVGQTTCSSSRGGVPSHT